jgi:MFS family permease
VVSSAVADVRRRPSLAPFVLAVAFGSTAYIASFTAGALAAREITGSAQLSGLPSALGTIGTAIAIAVLSGAMGRWGRRAGLTAGLASGVAGATVTVIGVAAASFPLLLAGSLAVGFGNAALQLSRYAASDLVAPERRAGAVGIVVWGSTVGAVLGPNLLQPAAAVAEWLGRGSLEGAMAATVLLFGLALLVVVVGVPGRRPAVESATPALTADAPRTSGRLGLLAPIRVRIALIGMTSGQIVMVLIMTMTPVHVHDTGHSLATVGFVISAHTLGMYALSPLSARLVDRLGAIPVMFGGFGLLLVAAVLAAIARDTEIPVLTLGLFLLGYGWNLGFVAGSSMLAVGADLAQRIRLQGLTDVVVWTASAVAGVSSGLLLDIAGYAALSLVAGALLAIPALAIAAGRSSLRSETAAERAA